MSVTEAHFRAVAKIAFHYALSTFRDLTGAEPEFVPIRNFIWAGGNADGFVRQRRDQFVANFRRERPTHWMLILAITRSYGGSSSTRSSSPGRAASRHHTRWPSG
jgi:hypothetical protein